MAVTGAGVTEPMSRTASSGAPSLSGLGSSTTAPTVSAGGSSDASRVTGSLAAGHSGALPGMLAASGLILALALWWGAGQMASASEVDHPET